MTNYLLNAAIKGIIEGLTEFLPISSTAHLVLVRDFFPLMDTAADKAEIDRLNDIFDIVIQFPAIIAVVILYWKRLWDTIRTIPQRRESLMFWVSVLVAFFPAAVAGLLFHKKIEEKLMSPRPIAVAFILGGIVLIVLERIAGKNTVTRAEDVKPLTALKIGLFQCLGLIPGTSRSGATIVGGRLSDVDRFASAEFSFFLAIPTMFAAFSYKMFVEHMLHPDRASAHINWSTDGGVLIVGSIASFLSAWIVISLFIKYLQKHDLSVFGWYRIVLGILILIFVKSF